MKGIHKVSNAAANRNIANAPRQSLHAWLELGKLHLSLYIALSAIFGFAAGAGVLHDGALFVGGSVFLLAAGAGVLNNIQDREYDRFFVRTCGRSLPSGRVKMLHAAALASLLILCGAGGLLSYAGTLPFFLGIAAIICYNVLYTPLKKITFSAMIPGSLCGMIVPAIGWTAAGGHLFDPVLLAVMAVFGTWQMAHFFVILIKTRHRMRHLPGANKPANFYILFPARQIRLLTMVWTGLYALGMLLFTMKTGILLHASAGPAIVTNALLTWALIFFILFRKNDYSHLAFAAVNLSILVFMGTGIATAFGI